MISSSFTQAPNSRKQKEQSFALDYSLCFVSFLGLSLNSLLGMSSILIFLLPWPLFYLKKFNTINRGLLKNWRLFLYPMLAALSTLWSADPAWTFKASAELFITVIVGIIIGYCIKQRAFMCAILSALVVVTFISIFTMWHTLVDQALGDVPIQGIFGSKNAFAATMAFLFLTALSILPDKEHGRFFRVLAGASLIGVPPLLYLAHSLGAILAVIMTVGIFVVLQGMKRLPKSLKIIFVFTLALLAIILVLGSTLTEIGSDDILVFLGKDPSLTGRTLLWNHAVQNILERPFFGIGYSAFWRLENPEAQFLWYESHVPPGAGFNFHNEYLQVFVELGLTGLLLCVGYLFVLTKRVFNTLFVRTTALENNFVFLLWIYILIRSPVEVGIFGQFAGSMILFCAFWIYMKPPQRPSSPLPLVYPLGVKTNL